MLGMRLCVLHNLYFYNNMMEEIRDALDNGNFAEYKKKTIEGFSEYEELSTAPGSDIAKNWRKG